MTDPRPIACTLGASDLSQRLDEIAALGAESLLGDEAGGGVHTLRFRQNEATRRQLEEIADAEARCCSFLDLGISRRWLWLSCSGSGNEAGGVPLDRADTQIDGLIRPSIGRTRGTPPAPSPVA